jgi:hypothetical protein
LPTIEELLDQIRAAGATLSRLSNWTAAEGGWHAQVCIRHPELEGDLFFGSAGASAVEALQGALLSFQNRGDPPKIKRFTQSGRSAIPPIGELSLNDLGL